MSHDRDPPDEHGGDDVVGRAMAEVHRSVVRPDGTPLADLVQSLAREMRLRFAEQARWLAKLDKDVDKVDEKLRGNGDPGLVAEVSTLKTAVQRLEHQATLYGGRLWSIVDRWLIPLLILGGLEALRRAMQQ